MDERQLVVGAIIVDSLLNPSQVLAARRSRPAELAGRWEFPGGKVEAGESPQEALAREILEELGADINVGDELSEEAWPISDHLDLRLFFAEITSGALIPGETHDAVRWLALQDVGSVPWLPADAQALGTLAEAVRST
jgi:8-oxo-dGTP diphosphatase